MAHSPLLVVKNTQRLYCYHIHLLRQTQSPWQMSLPGLCAVSSCSWIHSKLKEIIFETLTGSIYLKKWQGLAIVIKGSGLMAKTCGASVFQPPPSLFLPKDRGPFPLQPCHQASHKHVEGALRLTFSPLTWRITNNCQTNKEKCSSFWETAKRLQYVLGNDLSF